jgi:hypothetical protein
MSTALLIVLGTVAQLLLVRVLWLVAHRRGYRAGFNRAYALRDAAELATEQEGAA